LRGKDQYPSSEVRIAVKLSHALVLAVVQSITEFLPVSSSGHLVIFSKLLGAGEVPLLFDLVLHLGTLTAVVVVYAGAIRDILSAVFAGRGARAGADPHLTRERRHSVKLFWYVLLSTAVTGTVGAVFRSPIESFFHARASFVPLFLLVTGAILLATRFSGEKGKGIGDIGVGFPLVVGVAQAVAMLPGVSRSGTTVSAGLLCGSSREFAGLYSFILSIPSIAAATGVEYLLARGEAQAAVGPGVYAAGYALAGLLGYGALRLFLGILARGKLFVFSFYCFAAGIAGYIFMNA
jgi:undecaprenyl-diphosphatase